MKSLFVLWVPFLFLLSWNNCGYSQIKEQLKTIVYTLASDSLQGRGTGTEGQKKAAQYIVNFYQQNKIPNIWGTFDSTGYLQKFSIERYDATTRLIAVYNNDTVKFSETHAFIQNREKIVIDSEIKVFRVKTAKDLKIVTDTLRHEGTPVAIVLPSRLYSSLTKKLFNRVFLLPQDSSFAEEITSLVGEYDFMLNFLRRFSFNSDRIVFLMNQNETKSKKLFTINNDEVVIQSGVRFLIARGVRHRVIFTENVVSAVFANDPKAPWIVLGAHYDHLGFGGKGSGSLTPNLNKIHPGADDNASGTAAIMSIAQYCSEKGNTTHNNLMFVAFTAEELGLYGSQYFVNSRLLPTKTKAMINFDMIGRPENPDYQRNYVYAKKLPKHNSTFYPMKNVTVDSLEVVSKTPFLQSLLFRWGSDHVNFRRKHIPCLVIFTGTHNNYHTPADTPNKLEYDNMERIVRWVILLLEKL